MRRQRQWLDASVSSPTSRRRLEDSPTGDVVRQFGSALDAVDITLQLPSPVIDLTGETELDNSLLQSPVGEVDNDNNEEEETDEDELLLPRESSQRSSVNIEDMIERSVVRTISRAYSNMIAQISPPGTPPPPPPPALMLPAPPAPLHVQHITPRTPPARPPPTAPPAVRRRRAHLDTQSQGSIPLDTVLLRIRGRREPQLVVRLPGGGFSYAPSPMYSEERNVLSPAGRRRGRRARRSIRVSEMPIVRQTLPEDSALSQRLEERLNTRENERIRRIRRQLRLDEQQLTHLEVRPRGVARSPVLAWSNLANSLRGVDVASGAAGAAAQAQPVQPRLIPFFVATEEMGVPEGKCGICLEEFKAGTKISIIPCQPEGVSGTKDHVFCHPCIQQWVHACRGQRSCPLCRGAF